MPKAPTQRSKHTARDAASPFAFKVVAKRGQRGVLPPTLTVTLSIPAEEDECPLTLDTIKASKLEFLPDTPFCQERPQHSKLTLPCGHAFHALSLLYSWCKSGMRCPCCRAGHEERADPACLPRHLRSAVADRVQATLTSERSEEEVRIYGVTVPYSVLSQQGCLKMVILFFERVDCDDPLFSLTARLDEASTGTEERPVFSPRCHFPSMANIHQMRVGAVRLQVHIDIPDVASIGIDSTRNVPLTEGDICVPGAHGRVVEEVSGVRRDRTRFEIRAAEGRWGLALQALRWCPEGQFMELLSVEEE